MQCRRSFICRKILQVKRTLWRRSILAEELLPFFQKLKSKNFDLIVLNSLKDQGAGFGHDTNKVTLLDGRSKKDLPLKSKKEVAGDIVQAIIEKIHA